VLLCITHTSRNATPFSNVSLGYVILQTCIGSVASSSRSRAVIQGNNNPIITTLEQNMGPHKLKERSARHCESHDAASASRLNFFELTKKSAGSASGVQCTNWMAILRPRKHVTSLVGTKVLPLSTPSRRSYYQAPSSCQYRSLLQILVKRMARLLEINRG
jgi:hypothetical protein